MIGKIRKGRSFGGCIRYVTQKDDAEIASMMKPSFEIAPRVVLTVIVSKVLLPSVSMAVIS